jgi:hypothetical protein
MVQCCTTACHRILDALRHQTVRGSLCITITSSNWVETRLQLTCNALQCSSDPCSAGNGFSTDQWMKRLLDSHQFCQEAPTQTSPSSVHLSMQAFLLAAIWSSYLPRLLASTVHEIIRWISLAAVYPMTASSPVIFLSESEVMINRNEKQPVLWWSVSGWLAWEVLLQTLNFAAE